MNCIDNSEVFSGHKGLLHCTIGSYGKGTMSDESKVHDLPPIPKSEKTSSPGLWIMLLSPVVAVSPFLVGGPLQLLFCPKPANEGNCGWVALGWFGLITIPVGGIMFIVGLVTLVAGAAKSAIKRD